MSGLLATLPVQLACQLITPGNNSFDNITLNGPISQQRTVLPDGYTSFPDIGVAMKYYSNDLLWNVARKHCIMEGGNLAVMDSIEKCQYGNALRKTNPRGPMLGIHKLFDTSEWVSAKTGLPLPFIPWKSGTDRGTTAQSCTALWGDNGGRVGAWDCNTSWSYLCEISLYQYYKCEVQSSPAHAVQQYRPTPRTFNPVNVLPLHLAFQLLVPENSFLVNVDIDTTFPKLITELPSGYIVLPEFGAAYKYFDHVVRWNVARQYCVGQGGNLVVVDTFEKLKYVLDMKKSGAHMHTGFHKLFDDAEWTDLRTGLPALTIPWRAEPIHSATRKCAALMGDRTGVVAISCDEAYTFVCEILMFKG